MCSVRFLLPSSGGALGPRGGGESHCEGRGSLEGPQSARKCQKGNLPGPTGDLKALGTFKMVPKGSGGSQDFDTLLSGFLVGRKLLFSAAWGSRIGPGSSEKLPKEAREAPKASPGAQN